MTHYHGCSAPGTRNTTTTTPERWNDRRTTRSQGQRTTGTMPPSMKGTEEAMLTTLASLLSPLHRTGVGSARSQHGRTQPRSMQGENKGAPPGSKGPQRASASAETSSAMHRTKGSRAQGGKGSLRNGPPSGTWNIPPHLPSPTMTKTTSMPRPNRTPTSEGPALALSRREWPCTNHRAATPSRNAHLPAFQLQLGLAARVPPHSVESTQLPSCPVTVPRTKGVGGPWA